jgi:hypothetical protein
LAAFNAIAALGKQALKRSYNRSSDDSGAALLLDAPTYRSAYRYHYGDRQRLGDAAV